MHRSISFLSTCKARTGAIAGLSTRPAVFSKSKASTLVLENEVITKLKHAGNEAGH